MWKKVEKVENGCGEGGERKRQEEKRKAVGRGILILIYKEAARGRRRR